MRHWAAPFFVLSLLHLAFGCSKSQPSQAEIDRQVAAEVAKIAAEKARLSALTDEKRGELVAELAQRNEQLEDRKRLLAENIAAERLRRETIATAVRDYVDALPIITGQKDGHPRVLLGNQVATDGFVLVAPFGATITYAGRQGDYFIFTYTEEAFGISLKRMARSLSIVTWTANKPMADGTAIEPTPFTLGSSVTTSLSSPQRAEIPVRGSSFFVVSATYGAGTVHRDVSKFVKQKVMDGRLEMAANSSELGGDPIFGEVKSLRIKYHSGGRILERDFREGDRVSLP